MKQIAYFLILISFETFSQKTHAGSYFTAKKDVVFEMIEEIFDFNEKGEFRYFEFGRGEIFGKGKHERTKDDSLKLFFEECTNCKEVKDLIIESEKSDSVEIDLKILFQEDNSELPMFFLRDGIQMNETFNNGRLKIKLTKQKKERNLEIGFVGFFPVTIKVKETYSKITGIVRLGYHSLYNEGDYMAFKILKWNKRKLKLIRSGTHNISYIRLNKNLKKIKNRQGDNGYDYYQKYFLK